MAALWPNVNALDLMHLLGVCMEVAASKVQSGIKKADGDFLLHILHTSSVAWQEPTGRACHHRPMMFSQGPQEQEILIWLGHALKRNPTSSK